MRGELGLQAPPRASRLPWAALAAAAAVLVGLAILGPLLEGLRGPGDEARLDTTRREEALSATTAAAGAPATTVPAADSRTQQPEAVDGFAPAFLGGLGPVEPQDLEDLLRHPAFDTLSSATRRDVDRLRREAEASRLGGLPCYREGYRLSDRNLVAVVGGTATFRDTPAVIIAYASAQPEGDAPLDERTLRVMAVDGCGLLHSQSGMPGP